MTDRNAHDPQFEPTFVGSEAEFTASVEWMHATIASWPSPFREYGLDVIGRRLDEAMANVSHRRITATVEPPELPMLHVGIRQLPSGS